MPGLPGGFRELRSRLNELLPGYLVRTKAALRLKKKNRQQKEKRVICSWRWRINAFRWEKSYRNDTVDKTCVLSVQMRITGEIAVNWHFCHRIISIRPGNSRDNPWKRFVMQHLTAKIVLPDQERGECRCVKTIRYAGPGDSQSKKEKPGSTF